MLQEPCSGPSSDWLQRRSTSKQQAIAPVDSVGGPSPETERDTLSQIQAVVVERRHILGTQPERSTLLRRTLLALSFTHAITRWR